MLPDMSRPSPKRSPCLFPKDDSAFFSPFLSSSVRELNISSAERDLESEWFDMVPGDLTGGRDWSRKGLRDRGRAGGSSKGEAGDTARLRKGLFEERLMLRPTGGWSTRWNESEADIVATAGAEAVCDAAVCRRRCRRLGDGEWESKRARLRAMQ